MGGLRIRPIWICRIQGIWVQRIPWIWAWVQALRIRIPLVDGRTHSRRKFVPVVLSSANIQCLVTLWVLVDNIMSLAGKWESYAKMILRNSLKTASIFLSRYQLYFVTTFRNNLCQVNLFTYRLIK